MKEIFNKLKKKLVRLWLGNTPECFCGYNMKHIPPSNAYEYDTWHCLWKKKCGWHTYEGTNGKLHWFKRFQL